MATEILRLEPKLLPALRAFAARVWQRPRSEAFYRWRYEDPSFHLAFLAMRDGECLAMESAFRRPWRVGDEVVDVLEVFDWYCLPELQKSGLGVRVMQRLMQEPEPLLLVGGTPDTQGLLPRMRWQVVGASQRYVLPIGPERAGDELARRAHVPVRLARAIAPAALRISGRRPRPRSVPRGGRVLAVGAPGPELEGLLRGPIGYGTVPLWTEERARWLLAGFAGAGHFVPLYFLVDDALRGFVLLRIHPAPHGCDAEIVELFAPQPDAALYTWMVSEAACRAAAFGADVIGASTTCAAVEEGLRRNRFLRTVTNPVQLWWPAREGLKPPLLIGSNTGDSPFLPLVDRWWE